MILSAGTRNAAPFKDPCAMTPKEPCAQIDASLSRTAGELSVLFGLSSRSVFPECGVPRVPRGPMGVGRMGVTGRTGLTGRTGRTGRTGLIPAIRAHGNVSLINFSFVRVSAWPSHTLGLQEANHHGTLVYVQLSAAASLSSSFSCQFA